MSVITGDIVIDSALARRNPTLKLSLLTVVSLVAIFILDLITPTVLYLLALIAVAASVRVSLGTLAVAHVPFLARDEWARRPLLCRPRPGPRARRCQRETAPARSAAPVRLEHAPTE